MNTLQDVVDTICIVYFTLEYIVRFMCAPKKLRFIMQPMNQARLGLSELNSSTPKATTENFGYTDTCVVGIGKSATVADCHYIR